MSNERKKELWKVGEKKTTSRKKNVDQKKNVKRINSEGINNKLCVWVLIFTMNSLDVKLLLKKWTECVIQSAGTAHLPKTHTEQTEQQQNLRAIV